MKRYFTPIILLVFLAACSTSGQLVSSNPTFPAQIVIPNNNPVEQHRPVKMETDEARKISEPSAKEKSKPANIPVVPAVKKEQSPAGMARKDEPSDILEAQIIEDDDDITTLLGSTDVQNFDIPIVFNDAVKYYIRYFTEEKKKVFGNWLKRARWYVPIITEILRKNDMPEDLVYLAMIESGFNPKAYSHAKACGPWQFIYETGGRYGLKVNYWIDERRDPEKSTVAAAKYLRDLFNQFGHWYLAAAGYNAGEKRIERAIEKHNTTDFWELYKYNTLPKETRNYIPQLIAAAVIAKDPEKFGFGSIVYDPPIQFVDIPVPPATPLPAIAKASLLDIIDVRAYNPELVRGITPPDDEYEVKLPYPTDPLTFNERLQTALEGERKIKSIVTHKVRKRDTLQKIAKKYGVKSEDIQLVNGCDEELKIKPGMVIAIPRFSGPPKTVVAKSLDRENQGPGSKPIRRTRMDEEASQVNTEKLKPYHIVKKGETLASISDKYGVDVADLKSINNLKNGKVRPKMKLKLVNYSKKNIGKKAEEKELVKVKYHIVKKGETLASISDKYGVDVADVKAANHLKNNKIFAKMKLKIVVKEG